MADKPKHVPLYRAEQAVVAALHIKLCSCYYTRSLSLFIEVLSACDALGLSVSGVCVFQRSKAVAKDCSAVAVALSCGGRGGAPVRLTSADLQEFNVDRLVRVWGVSHPFTIPSFGPGACTGSCWHLSFLLSLAT